MPYERMPTEAEIACLVDAAHAAAAPPPPPDPGTLGRGKRARTSYAGAAAGPSPHAPGHAVQGIFVGAPQAAPIGTIRGRKALVDINYEYITGAGGHP